jgi:4-diphosphocytidyl-2-C-methyl-D-erythritol kinase
MNELFCLQLTTEQLCALGEKLGSDVPFCICGGTMLAEGRGEKLTRLPDMPECFVVLAKPAADVSTAWVYQNYRPEQVDVHPDTRAVIECLERTDLNGISQLLCNVLESVTINKYEEIQKYKTIMCKCGALASLMSGSGSTVFALAATEQHASAIATELAKMTAAQVFITKTISRN